MTRRSTRSSTRSSTNLQEQPLNLADAAPLKRKSSARDIHPRAGETLGFLTNAIDLELEMRCKRLKSTAEDCVRSMNNEFHVAMMKLPKAIRQMPISQFQERYQGTASKVKDEEMAMLKQTLDTPRQRQLRSRTVACTPASKKKMATPARKCAGTVGQQQAAGKESAIKPREIQVTKPMPGTPDVGGVLADMSAVVDEVDGCTDEASRAATKDKLKAMQAHLASLMNKIESQDQ